MIYIGSDHGGFQLKKFLKSYLKSVLRVAYKDMGPDKFVATDDLQDYAIKVGKAVAKTKTNRGILICKGGNGMVMTANKIKGVRAIMGFSIENTEWSVRDDHANVLCLGSEYVTREHAAAIVKKFLAAEFDNDPRFIRRRKKMEKLEK